MTLLTEGIKISESEIHELLLTLPEIDQLIVACVRLEISGPFYLGGVVSSIEI